MKTQTNVPLPETYQRDDALLAILHELKNAEAGASRLYKPPYEIKGMQNRIHSYGYKNGISFKTRKDKETGMMRIWRA